MRYNFIIYLMFFLTAVSVAGCGPLNEHVYKSPQNPPGKYDVVQIPDFRKDSSPWVPYDSVTMIPDMLYDKLLASKKFKLVERDADPLKHEEKVLLVKGDVTYYDRGCKFCEWFFFGLHDKGKSTTSVWVQLVDKSTGDVITDFSLNARAEDPGYGKSRYTRIVDAIARNIDKVSK